MTKLEKIKSDRDENIATMVTFPWKKLDKNLLLIRSQQETAKLKGMTCEIEVLDEMEAQLLEARNRKQIRDDKKWREQAEKEKASRPQVKLERAGAK